MSRSIVESGPVVTTLPKSSSTVTTGCVANAAPAVAPEGWVVYTSWLAVLWVIAKVVESAAVRLPSVAVSW